MGRFENALKELAEKYDIDEEDLEKLSDSSIAREEIKNFKALERERDELAAKVETYEAAPKRIQALKDAGIDWDSLNKRDQRIVERELTDYDDPEKVSEFINEWGFEATEQPVGDTKPAAQAGVNEALRGASSTNNQTKSRQQLIDEAQTPEALQKVLEQFPEPVTSAS